MSEIAFSDRLKHLVDEHTGGNVSAFARLTGITYGSIQTYLRGRSEPTMASAVAIATATGVSVEWLATGELEEQEGSALELTDGTPLPVLGEIPAGIGIERALSVHAEEHVIVDRSLAPLGARVFGLTVVGTSMVGYNILPGDVAVCNLSASFAVGDVVAYYQASTGESTIKQLGAWKPGGRTIQLVPHNALEQLAPYRVDLSASDQLVRVTGLLRRFPPRR